MEEFQELVNAIKCLNTAGEVISRIIERPAEKGHTGEYIASRVFDIQLHPSAVQKDSDGFFTTGPLAGREVNIKWYAHCAWILDLKADAPSGLFYLILTGPVGTMGSSKGKLNPWVITRVYLFDGDALVSTLRSTGVKIGVASSVRQQLWHAAEVYPDSNCNLLTLTRQQKDLLALFS